MIDVDDAFTVVVVVVFTVVDVSASVVDVDVGASFVVSAVVDNFGCVVDLVIVVVGEVRVVVFIVVEGFGNISY